LGQLVSIEAQVAKAGVDIHVERGVGNICKFYAGHVAVGTISAGVDLTNVTEDNILIDNETNTYTINLPAPQLTGCTIDPVQTQQYASSGATPLCPIDWDAVRRLASYVALREF